jgi:hypothetical protein
MNASSVSSRAALLLPVLAATTGCASSEIWLLSLKGADSAACGEPIITHTFINATVPDPALTSDWSPGYRYEETSSLVYAQLTTTSGKEGVLLVGDRAYEGERDGKDWTFQWSGKTGEADWQDHYSGYGYAEYYDTEESVTIKLSIDGASASGTWSSEGLSETRWAETDTWNEDGAAAVGWDGVIPASSYLEVPDGTGGTMPATNAGDVVDCDDADRPNVCLIAATVQCEDSRGFTGQKLDHDEEAAYAHLAEAGNSPQDPAGGTSGSSGGIDVPDDTSSGEDE